MLFEFDHVPASEPLIESYWLARDMAGQRLLTPASCCWELVVSTVEDETEISLRGPTKRATTFFVEPNAHLFGIRLRMGVFMPSLAVGRIAWERPSLRNADAFIDGLIRRGLLLSDPVVQSALRGELAGVSQRSVERRVKLATGLTLGTIRQIRRAQVARELLDQGIAICDVVAQAGYADQAHLTRSMKRFIGHTPAQIAKKSAKDWNTSVRI